MPRPSAAALAVINNVQRPKPPEDMPDLQKEIWNKTVNRLPPEWFVEETIPLLKQYCRLCVRADRLSQFYSKNMPRDDFYKILPLELETTKQIVNLATRMRITQQSFYDKAKSKRLSQVRRAEFKPWDKKADQEETEAD